MTGDRDDSTRRMRDAFRVWNVDRVEREVVLRSSDDQYVAVPLPDEHADRFEDLENTSRTVDATLVRSDELGTAWRVEEIHAVDEESNGE